MMHHSWKGMAGLLLAGALVVPTLAIARGGSGFGGRGPGGGFEGPGFGGPSFGGIGRRRGLVGTISSVNSAAGSLSVQAQVGSLATPITLLVPAIVPR